MAAGRPTLYNKELADRICYLISTSEKGLHMVCKLNKDLPHVATIYKWLDTYKEFNDNYARARQDQADLLADNIIEIADDSTNDTQERDGIKIVNHDTIARARLRVDARKWKASKLYPKRYGDKIEAEVKHSGEINLPIINWVKPSENKEE